eukprot:gene10101-biopygen7737
MEKRQRTRAGRAPDAGRTIAIRATDAGRTRTGREAVPFLPTGHRRGRGMGVARAVKLPKRPSFFPRSSY